MDPLERKSSSLPATRSQGRPGGHAAMAYAINPPPQKPPWTQIANEAVYLAFYVRLCFYVIRAFLPSLPSGRRYAHPGIKSPLVCVYSSV